MRCDERSEPGGGRCRCVWDTVGSLGLPLASAAGKVGKYRFLDTHLRRAIQARTLQARL
jgi:hypothetical protein